jgi:hypothetical protein
VEDFAKHADRSGALCDLELTPNRWAVLAEKRGIIVHANHFCSSDLASEEALLQNMPDSALRQFQMEALLMEQHGGIGFDHRGAGHRFLGISGFQRL